MMIKKLLASFFTLLLWGQVAHAALVLNHSGIAEQNLTPNSISFSAGDVVVLYLNPVTNFGSAQTVTSITGTTLTTWTRRGGITPFVFGPFGVNLESWWAVAPSTGTDTLTITYNGSSANIAQEFVVYYAISGANTTTPFDVNVSLPQATRISGGVTPAQTISTTNANTFILSALSNIGASPPDPGTGYTGGPNNASSPAFDSQYKIVSSVQTSLAVNWGPNDASAVFDMAMMSDAVQIAGAGAAAPPMRTLMGVGQ